MVPLSRRVRGRGFLDEGGGHGAVDRGYGEMVGGGGGAGETVNPAYTGATVQKRIHVNLCSSVADASYESLKLSSNYSLGPRMDTDGHGFEKLTEAVIGSAFEKSSGPRISG